MIKVKNLDIIRGKLLSFLELHRYDVDTSLIREAVYFLGELDKNIGSVYRYSQECDGRDGCNAISALDELIGEKKHS